MSLTVTKLEKIVLYRLGYEKFPAEVSIIDIANEAGWWLASARQWNWLRREPYSLNLVADQEYITLPSDLGSVLGIHASGTSGLTLQLVPIESLADLRASNMTAGVGSGYVGAIVTPSSPVSGPNPDKRLELWPTPADSLLEAFLMTYRAGFQAVSAGTEHIIVPQWLEAAFKEAAVCHAMAATKKGAVLSLLLVQNVEPLLQYLDGHDAMEQEDMGPLENTAAMMTGLSINTLPGHTAGITLG